MPASRMPGPVGVSDRNDARWPPHALLRFASAGMVGESRFHAQMPQPVLVTGDFTMLKYLMHRSAAELERHLGFEAGRLSRGYQIVALAPGEALGPEDFDLGASTRWSGGAITAGGEGRLAAGAVVADSISDLIAQRGQDIGELKARVAAFFSKSRENTPAKVLPRWAHESWMQYPDANVLDGVPRSGVPQFKLTRPRSFVTISCAGWF